VTIRSGFALPAFLVSKASAQVQQSVRTVCVVDHLATSVKLALDATKADAVRKWDVEKVAIIRSGSASLDFLAKTGSVSPMFWVKVRSAILRLAWDANLELAATAVFAAR